MQKVYILSGKRTPIGALKGALSSVPSTELGGLVIKSAMASSGLKPDSSEEVLMGCVMSGGLGPAPGRRMAVLGGLPLAPAALVSAGCGSGLRAIVAAATRVAAGAKAAVAGGVDSMSRAPHCIDLRRGVGWGGTFVIDSVTSDALNEPRRSAAVGSVADAAADELGIQRAELDEYARRSRVRALHAREIKAFDLDITPVEGPKGKVTADELLDSPPLNGADFSKVPASFLPLHMKTPQRATALNSGFPGDGACAFVLAGPSLASAGATPLFELLSSGSAGSAGGFADFVRAPAAAARAALDSAGLSPDRVDLWQVCENFAVAPLAFTRALDLSPEKVNPLGGEIAFGAPLAAQGAHSLLSLISALRVRRKEVGVAVVGGNSGAVAVVVRNLAVAAEVS